MGSLGNSRRPASATSSFMSPSSIWVLATRTSADTQRRENGHHQREVDEPPLQARGQEALEQPAGVTAGHPAFRRELLIHGR